MDECPGTELICTVGETGHAGLAFGSQVAGTYFIVVDAKNSLISSGYTLTVTLGDPY